MRNSENLKRVIVSIIAIPVILAATFLGGYYFFSFVVIISLISFYEFGLLAKHKGAELNLFPGGVAIVVLLFNQLIGFVDFIVVILLSSLSLLVFELFRNRGSAVLNLGVTFLGVFYIGVFSASIIALREFYPDNNVEYVKGAFLLISILAAIWIGDSAAYYGGTAFGRHKLFPRVSPKKSWEGAIAGFLFAVLTMIVFKLAVLDFLSWTSAIGIGIIIGLFGQIGDLIESLFKRDSGVKDSSGIIPGHGGIFDRFDSLIFSAPFILLLLNLLEK